MVTYRELAERAGISPGYASDIMSGKRKLGLVAALNIYAKAGIKLGPLADMSDEVADQLLQQAAA